MRRQYADSQSTDRSHHADSRVFDRQNCLIPDPAEDIFDVFGALQVGLAVDVEVPLDTSFSYSEIEVAGGNAHIDSLYVIGKAIAVAWLFCLVEVAVCILQDNSPGLFV